MTCMSMLCLRLGHTVFKILMVILFNSKYIVLTY